MWRKSTMLSVLALLLLSTLFRWRHLLTTAVWLGALLALAGLGALAWVRPRCFRGYYRFSTWAGFWSSQWVARAALAVIFVAIITPAGLVLRLLGKDPLHLKRSPNATSYWKPAKKAGSLDRLF